MADQPIRITLAGGCRLATDDGRWQADVPTRQGRLVLARLALAQSPVGRDELAELVWPNALPRAWERDLSAVVSRLRHLLAEAPVSTATVRGLAGVYELVLPAGSAIDVAEAEAAVREAERALDDDRLDAALAAARSVAEIARRPMVPGANSVWLDDRRAWLRSVLGRALAIEVDVAIARRDPGGADAAEQAIAADPFSERANENAMRLHLALGEHAAAIEVYARDRAALVDELGLAPVPALEELGVTAQRAASSDTFASATSAGTPRTPARAALPPLATTSFLGRQRALHELEVALAHSRLVTVTGPAGVGKTRLAFEAAHRLASRRRDGARVCELAHLDHPAGVAAAMAAAAGITPATGLSVEESLIGALASRQMLLVVDNCEHVVAAVAPLLEQLVERCRDVWVLATSRERLAINSEAVLPLQPLGVPDMPNAGLDPGTASAMAASAHAGVDPATASAMAAPALALLIDRVKAVRANFSPRPEEMTALVDICRRLDGLPLAIELAATRMASMAPVDVARRLDHRLALLTSGRRTSPSRHGTLRAAIEWSYELLDGDERKVFERASVFVGGFTLAAAETVCAEGDQARPAVIADVLAALVDKSLIRLDDRYASTRYQMFETLREFAHERLQARNALDAAARAHAEYFAALADTAEPCLRGPSECEWVAALDADTANFRVAHAWSRRTKAVDVAASLSGALAWFGFWRMRTEMMSWAEEFVELPEAASAARYAEAVAAAGRSAWMRGDLARSELLAEQAVAAGTTDRESTARFGWHVLGDVHLFRGDLDNARHEYEHAAELADRAGDVQHGAVLAGCRALVRSYAGDASSALELATRSRVDAVSSANPTALAWSDYVTGEVLRTVDAEPARHHLERARKRAATAANDFITGVAGLSAASLAARHGELKNATRAFVDVIDRFEQAGNWRQQWTAMREAVELLSRLGDHRAAALVLGAVEAADAENIFGDDAQRLTRLADELRAALGSSFDAATGDGRSLDRTGVITFVRDRLLRGHTGPEVVDTP